MWNALRKLALLTCEMVIVLCAVLIAIQMYKSADPANHYILKGFMLWLGFSLAMKR